MRKTRSWGVEGMPTQCWEEYTMDFQYMQPSFPNPSLPFLHMQLFAFLSHPPPIRLVCAAQMLLDVCPSTGVCLTYQAGATPTNPSFPSPSLVLLTPRLVEPCAHLGLTWSCAYCHNCCEVICALMYSEDTFFLESSTLWLLDSFYPSSAW